MPYLLTVGEPVDVGLRRVCAEQLELAIVEVGGDLDHHSAVHQVRKRCKKIRAVLRLIRDELGRDVYRRENVFLRDAARTLSRVRDAAVLIETCDRLATRFPDRLAGDVYAPFRRRLVARRERIADELGLDERLARFGERMREARARVAGWPVAIDDSGALRPAVVRGYRRARRAFVAACREPDVEAFHEWRKRVKYHGYHCRLLRDLWPDVLAPRRADVDRLAELLGDEHDLAILGQTLHHDSESFDRRDVDALVEIAERRQLVLRRRARPLGKRLFGEKRHPGIDPRATNGAR